MKPILSILLAAALLSCTAQNSGCLPADRTKDIDSFMTTLYNNGEFMGAVLVAEKGKVIYEKGFGFADRQTSEPFTPSTPCYVGSISKQFTAMGIVLLKEKGIIDYSGSIRRYFPDLPECYQPVTILNLLHHSSGLPRFDDYPGMTEQDVLNILLKQTSLQFVPGSKFEYCNANYSLLGMLIEKVSGKTLDEYLTANVFIPCGMKDTYVDEPSVTTRRRAVGYYVFGDKCDYSTYAYIEREVNYHNSIIFISNVRHDHIDDIRDAIVNILNDKPFSVPRISGANWIMRREKPSNFLS
jgi:CubicO group peptidase (beta-lactamase class C family)